MPKLRVFFLAARANAEQVELYSTVIFFEDDDVWYSWYNPARASLNVEGAASPVEVLWKKAHAYPYPGEGYEWIEVSPALWAAVCAQLLEASA